MVTGVAAMFAWQAIKHGTLLLTLAMLDPAATEWWLESGPQGLSVGSE